MAGDKFFNDPALIQFWLTEYIQLHNKLSKKKKMLFGYYLHRQNEEGKSQ